jgi:hypothetical protein
MKSKTGPYAELTQKNICIPVQILNLSAMLPPTMEERFLCLEANIFNFYF